MRHLLLSLLLLYTVCVSAQTVQQSAPTNDAAAILLAQQATTALTGGVPIIDVTLNANVISIAGSDYETGTGLLTAKGVSEARIDLNLSGGTRSDARNANNGTPAGAWEKNGASATQYAQHNCWTDAAWFFPALSSLTQSTNPNFIFKFIGQEQYNGVPAEHIQVFQLGSQNSYLAGLSTTDFYLDPVLFLPLGAKFNVHADNDMNIDIPAEVRFANYQPMSGVLVPFHVQRLLNGNLVLDLTVTGAIFNSGLQDTQFSLE